MENVALMSSASGAVGQAVDGKLATEWWKIVLVSRDSARQYPLPGIGSPDELAEFMVWLLSDKAAGVTGRIWSLDAGFSAVRPLVK